MRYDTVIFDLDGTLLDTLDDIAAAGNHAMSAVGRPTHDREAYRRLAGQGRDWMLEKALGPEHQHLFEKAKAAHAAYNADRLGKNTRPFPGVPDLLEALKQRDLKLAVLSNKPHSYTLREVAEQFPAGTFDLVIGHRDGYPVKPDPTSAHEMVESLGTSANRVVYVGDTAADMQTGRGASFFAVGVTWGFRERGELERSGADYIVDKPRDVVAALSAEPADPTALTLEDVHLSDHEPGEYGPYLAGFRAVRMVDATSRIRGHLVWRVGIDYHVEITDIGVDQPLDRRRGVGTRLMHEGLASVRRYYRDVLKRPLQRVYLFCDAPNTAAREFYESHGFVCQATVPGLVTYCEAAIYVLDCASDEGQSGTSSSSASQSA